MRCDGRWQMQTSLVPPDARWDRDVVGFVKDLSPCAVLCDGPADQLAGIIVPHFLPQTRGRVAVWRHHEELHAGEGLIFRVDVALHAGRLAYRVARSRHVLEAHVLRQQVCGDRAFADISARLATDLLVVVDLRVDEEDLRKNKRSLFFGVFPMFVPSLSW